LPGKHGVATSRKRLELQVGQLEQHVGELGGQSRAGMEAGQGGIADEGQVSRGTTERRLAGLRRQYAAMRAEEQRVSAANRRLQAKVDAFRAAKEAIGPPTRRRKRRPRRKSRRRSG